VVLPGSTAEVAALLRLCQQRQLAVVPQGGNTSTCGAATPDSSGHQLVIAMQRMNRLRAIDTDNNSITVEAGMTLARLQQLAAEAGRLFPLSLASEGSCQIGGNLSTNAGGLAVLRYGTMRELTLGLEVVLPDGQVLHQLSGLRKNTSGLDVKQLFIGAEGQLGLITAATLKLFAQPSAHATAWLGVQSSQAAIALLSALRQAFGDRLTTFEIMSQPCQQLLENTTRANCPSSSPGRYWQNCPTVAIATACSNCWWTGWPRRIYPMAYWRTARRTDSSYGSYAKPCRKPRSATAPASSMISACPAPPFQLSRAM
jgi:FAD/FMN-containing dehydrogenase